LKVSLVLLTAATVLAMATGAAPPIASAMAGIDQFGFIAIRSGIPAGVSHFEVTSPDLQNEHAFSQSEIANIFREVKNAFDPQNLLNPGKVVGDDPLIAAVGVVMLGLTAALQGAGVAAWWLLPAAVVVVLSLSLRRATRS